MFRLTEFFCATLFLISCSSSEKPENPAAEQEPPTCVGEACQQSSPVQESQGLCDNETDCKLPLTEEKSNTVEKLSQISGDIDPEDCSIILDFAIKSDKIQGLKEDDREIIQAYLKFAYEPSVIEESFQIKAGEERIYYLFSLNRSVVQDLGISNQKLVCSVPNKFIVFPKVDSISTLNLPNLWRHEYTEFVQDLCDNGKSTCSHNLAPGSHYKGGLHISIPLGAIRPIFNFYWKFNPVVSNDKLSSVESLNFDLNHDLYSNCSKITLLVSHHSNFQDPSLSLEKASGVCFSKNAPFIDSDINLDLSMNEDDIEWTLRNEYIEKGYIWFPLKENFLFNCELSGYKPECYPIVIDNFMPYIQSYIRGLEDLFVKVTFEDKVELVVKLDKTPGKPEIVSQRWLDR